MKRTFASDNYSGVCAPVMQALQEANRDHTPGYGNDPWTQEARDLFAAEFGDDAAVHFVFNGTAANVLSLRAMTRSYHSILCAQHSHLYIHETGAVQTHTGCKVMALPGDDGKLTVEQIQRAVERESYWGHHATKPSVVSITQPTELGVLYLPEEIQAIADYCHTHDLLLHMDGCRLFNAAVALDLSLRGLTRDLGVDVLSFGGTKNGLMFGEAVVLFRPELATDFRYLQKESLQLASKMRFVAAQYIPFLRDRVWHDNARQANQVAWRLAEGLRPIPGVTLSFPVETNQIFATMPPTLLDTLQASYPFYTWDPSRHEVRLVTSFDNTDDDVDQFLALAQKKNG